MVYSSKPFLPSPLNKTDTSPLFHTIGVLVALARDIGGCKRIFQTAYFCNRRVSTKSYLVLKTQTY